MPEATREIDNYQDPQALGIWRFREMHSNDRVEPFEQLLSLLRQGCLWMRCVIGGMIIDAPGS